MRVKRGRGGPSCARLIRMKTALSVIAVLCLLAFAGNPGDAQKIKGDDKDARKKATAEFIKRMDESSSLRWNASQMQAWSRYAGDDVLPQLIDIYNKPPGEFTDNMRYLAAACMRARHDVATEKFAAQRIEATEADIKALRKFVKNNRKNAADIWGVYCAACILALQDDIEIGIELLEIVGDTRAPAVIRAAVISALAHGGFEYMRRALEVMLTEDFKKTAEGAVMFEAICWAAARAYQPLHKEKQAVTAEWRGVFDTITRLLEDDKTLLPRSRREASLALQFCFKTRHPYQYAMMWRQVFDSGVDPMGEEGRTFAEFMGLDVMGDRIMFLIDASDSMLNPLSEDERSGMKGPITGDKKKKKSDGYEIDWNRVKNRFDVAREHVKWTLSRLGEDKQVCVILFGDGAEPLAVTEGFVSSANDRKIGAALDAIKPKDAEGNESRPHGVLMGETNYYQALLAAYRMGKGGGVKDAREHWDTKLVTEGADAIFLLSDGAPIRDGFSGDTPVIDYEGEGYAYYDDEQPGEGEWVEFPGSPAMPEREVETRDPETGAIRKIKLPARDATPPSRKWRAKETYSYSFESHDDNGPYASDSSFGFASSFELNNLLDEVERMNLVRRCRIHCVGIGEAKMSWLRPIAKKGGGKAVYFGKDGMREATEEDENDFPDFPGFPEDD
jgi:hypothetical protein